MLLLADLVMGITFMWELLVLLLLPSSLQLTAVKGRAKLGFS